MSLLLHYDYLKCCLDHPSAILSSWRYHIELEIEVEILESVKLDGRMQPELVIGRADFWRRGVVYNLISGLTKCT